MHRKREMIGKPGGNFYRSFSMSYWGKAEEEA
jgi:hypothetical protein